MLRATSAFTTMIIGETFSHYRVIELLGAGGMGEVYKAEDTRLRRTVALKFLPLAMVQDRDAKERLVLEAQAASALHHPNICTIHEIDETPDGRLFLAMAYYEGETLDRKSTRLNSSHGYISYAVFCLKKKKNKSCLMR